MKTFARYLMYSIAAIPFVLIAIICAVFVIPVETWKELKKKAEEDNERRN